MSSFGLVLLLANFLVPIPDNRKDYDIRKALSFLWNTRGSISVKRTSRSIYVVFLVRFEHEHEMNRSLYLDTRRVFGDLFCLKKLEVTDNIRDWFHTMEVFFVTIHNLYPEQVTSDNLRRYFSVNGHITSFGFPNRRRNGRFCINIKALVNIRFPIHFSVNAENDLGFINGVSFEFHNFPTNFCGYYDLLGHKISECARFEIAFQQEELLRQQAEMEAHWAAMQQQQDAGFQNHDPFAFDNLVESQPAMVQEGMAWTDDSLSTSSSSSLASEVTFNDLQRELDEEIVSQEERGQQHAAFQQVHSMLDFMEHDSIPSSNHPAANCAPSSSQLHLSQAEQDYWNNWNSMEKFFNEDSNLPAPKRLRSIVVVNNIEAAEASDAIVIEPCVNFLDSPHRWFKGQSSSDAVQGIESSHEPNL